MVKVKGSKDGNIVTAHFDGKSKSLFPSLKNTRALVLLSIVGNEFCTGEYLKAIVEKACATHEFTTFLIADEVYWHNLRQDFSKHEEEILRKQSTELGQEYFEKNLSIFLSPLSLSVAEFDKQELKQFPLNKMACLNKIAKEGGNFEVVFWGDWLKKSDEFLSKKDELQAQFYNEDKLLNSVEDTASNFARRHQTEKSPYDLLVKRSTGYLIEETPGVIWLSSLLGYNFIVYPGEIIKPFKIAKEYFIKSKKDEAGHLNIYSKKPELLSNWLEVSFKRTHSKTLKNVNKHQYVGSHGSEKNESLAAMMRGVTEGIFSQDLSYDEKIDCLSKILKNVSRNHQIES